MYTVWRDRVLLDLHNVGDDDLEAPDDHGLAGGDPADRLGHEDAADDAEDGLLDTEEPGDDGPVREERDSVQETDAHYGDDQAAHGEPEDEDGVVDVPQLPVKLSADRLDCTEMTEVSTW